MLPLNLILKLSSSKHQNTNLGKPWDDQVHQTKRKVKAFLFAWNRSDWSIEISSEDVTDKAILR